ncbi:MFS transporter-like protein, putative [Bodo saltans]|uniref:MFS transporter-like protein, putative n=1 Tax=Bodo saltans TaxID=75058 RepID=A0A0S4IYG1_BODSA|nr:MFS transporter-like protein, putative [Bodo saltans]|eukprot:CUG08162.1 MFS transporter-like protein, putative [Bodo saltans]
MNRGGPSGGASHPPPASAKSLESVRLTRVLLSLWAGYAGYTMARRPFSVARSEIEEETGISKFASSSVDTAFLLCYTVAQLMYGSYIKGRYSPRSILLAGLVGSALCCLIVALSSSGLMFTLAWGLNGCFQAAGWASCVTILTPWLASSERGRIMGIWGTNMAVGGILGNVITSYLMGRGFSWRWAVAADVVILIAVAVYMGSTLIHHPNLAGFLSSQQSADGLTWHDLTSDDGHFTVDGEFVPRVSGELGNSKAANGNATAAGPSSVGSGSEGRLSFGETLRVPGIAAISASYFFHKLVRYALMFWLPYYFNKELGYSIVAAGYMSASVDVGGVLGSVSAGFFSDWYAGGTRRAQATLFFVIGMAISTALFVVMRGALVGSVAACCFVSGLTGFFAFAIDSLMSGSYLQDYCERVNVIPYLGAISGVVGGIGAAGSIASGYLTVALSGASWNVLFSVLAAMTVFAGGLMWTPIRAEMMTPPSRKL